MPYVQGRFLTGKYSFPIVPTTGPLIMVQEIHQVAHSLTLHSFLHLDVSYKVHLVHPFAPCPKHYSFTTLLTAHPISWLAMAQNPATRPSNRSFEADTALIREDCIGEIRFKIPNSPV